jgi:hypothetical protein
MKTGWLRGETSVSVLAAGALFVTSNRWAQNAATMPDARTSDPVATEWMAGAAPPAYKTIRFYTRSFYRFPETRSSFSNMRQLIPSGRVARGSGKVRFASHHLEGNSYIDPHSLPAHEALAKHLMDGGR